MQALTSHQLEQLQFDNSLVKEMIVDQDKKVFSIKLDRAFIDQADSPIEIRDVQLRIEGFAGITARTYEDDEFSSIEASDQSHFLEELCEWSIEGEDLQLSGFSTREGAWTDFTISGGTFTVSHS